MQDTHWWGGHSSLQNEKENYCLLISRGTDSISLVGRRWGATTLGLSELEIDGNERVLHIPQTSSITGISLSDCLVSYAGHSLVGGSFLSAEWERKLLSFDLQRNLVGRFSHWRLIIWAGNIVVVMLADQIRAILCVGVWSCKRKRCIDCNFIGCYLATLNEKSLVLSNSVAEAQRSGVNALIHLSPGVPIFLI